MEINEFCISQTVRERCLDRWLAGGIRSVESHRLTGVAGVRPVCFISVCYGINTADDF